MSDQIGFGVDPIPTQASGSPATDVRAAATVVANVLTIPIRGYRLLGKSVWVRIQDPAMLAGPVAYAWNIDPVGAGAFRPFVTGANWTVIGGAWATLGVFIDNCAAFGELLLAPFAFPTGLTMFNEVKMPTQDAQYVLTFGAMAAVPVTIEFFTT